MLDIIKKYDIGLFSAVSFQLINTFEVQSIKRIPTNASCVLMFIFPYFSKKTLQGNISAYASVKDYHIEILKQLKSMCAELKEKYPNENFEPFVDASPIDEVDAAVKAGLGVKGKNSLLITKEYGSFVFIGEIITTMQVETLNHEYSYCINCGRCEKLCPGKCIDSGHVDSQRCASFISQKKLELTTQQQDILARANTVFGCDICQTCCPYNSRLADVDNVFAQDIINTITEDNILPLYKHRAFGFRGAKVLQRNLKIWQNNGK